MLIITNKKIISLIDHAYTNRSETNMVEFKDASGGLPTKNLWKTISSFSHQPGGGLIVFGIKEDRINNTIEVIGRLDLAILQERLTDYIQTMRNCGPYDLRILSYKGQSILAFIISETPDELKPCFNINLGLPNGACLRQGNTDRIMSEEEMRTFIRNNAVYKFDKTSALNTTLAMISKEKVQNLLIKSAEKVGRVNADNSVTPKVIRNLGIANFVDDKDIPTIAGYLIFSGEPPQNIRPYNRYIIRCVRYQGDAVSTPIIDRQEVDGTLDKQIETVQKFILRNISLKSEIIGSKRIDKFEYPEDAIRELVANAVIHRDYMITETYPQVNIFANRIEISNPGNLPPGITIENIKESQFSRNEIIASILRDFDYMEEYGRGIDIVFSRMIEWDLIKPIFKNTSNSFRVTLLGEKFKNLNERQVDIWYALQENEQMTAKRLNGIIKGVSRQTINADIKKLIEIGLVVSKGSLNSPTTFYEPKY